MTKVFKALQQAQRDRAVGAATRPEEAPEPSAPRSADVASQSSASTGIDPHLVSLLDPISAAAEQYRRLRLLVEQSQRAEQLAVLAVSAPTIGDGKTTTAINLAGALAQAPDVRVLLVDADLRRPSVTSRVALPDTGPGLVDAILNPAVGLSDVVRPCPPFNLSVLPAGPRSASPYEILKSPRLGALLDEARQRYDYIVVDTPPLVPIPDCQIIARFVDAFLVVVRAHKTPVRPLDEALAAIGSSRVLGLVFNSGDVFDSGYYYGAYAADHTGAGRNGSGPRGRARRPIDRLLRRHPAPENG